MATRQTISGRIIGCTPVEQYTKRNGELSVKCVYHLRSDDGKELAVSVHGDLTNYAGNLGMNVEVEYVNRVFEFERNGKNWYGNDVYATDIKMV